MSVECFHILLLREKKPMVLVAPLECLPCGIRVNIMFFNSKVFTHRRSKEYSLYDQSCLVFCASEVNVCQ